MDYPPGLLKRAARTFILSFVTLIGIYAIVVPLVLVVQPPLAGVMAAMLLPALVFIGIAVPVAVRDGKQQRAEHLARSQPDKEDLSDE
jgi:hypothetical protein